MRCLSDTSVVRTLRIYLGSWPRLWGFSRAETIWNEMSSCGTGLMSAYCAEPLVAEIVGEIWEANATVGGLILKHISSHLRSEFRSIADALCLWRAPPRLWPTNCNCPQVSALSHHQDSTWCQNQVSRMIARPASIVVWAWIESRVFHQRSASGASSGKSASAKTGIPGNTSIPLMCSARLIALLF